MTSWLHANDDEKDRLCCRKTRWQMKNCRGEETTVTELDRSLRCVRCCSKMFVSRNVRRSWTEVALSTTCVFRNRAQVLRLALGVLWIPNFVITFFPHEEFVRAEHNWWLPNSPGQASFNVHFLCEGQMSTFFFGSGIVIVLFAHVPRWTSVSWGTLAKGAWQTWRSLKRCMEKRFEWEGGGRKMVSDELVKRKEDMISLKVSLGETRCYWHQSDGKRRGYRHQSESMVGSTMSQRREELD